MRSSRALSMLLALTSAVLSACIDPGTTSGTAPAPGDETLAAGTGGIEGFVIDASLSPIEGAQVGILSTGAVTMTGSDGAFRLDDLPPGKHDVAAQKIGYASAATSVDVVEGGRATATLRLEPLPVVTPYFEVLVQRGSFGCGIAYRPQQAGIVGASVCGALTVFLGPNDLDRFLLLWELTGPYEGWSGAAYEMEWTTTQALGSGLWVRFETNNCAGSLESQFSSLRGRSPLREVQGAALVAEKLANNEASGCQSADECAPEKCVIMSRVFPHTEVLGDTYPADVGATLQQPFTQYFTQFYHGEPSPEYSAMADS